MPELYVGLISGTSMDAVDCVLVDLTEPTPRLAAARSHPIPPALRASLARVCANMGDDLDAIARLDVLTGELFAEAVVELLQAAGVPPSAIRAIGSHGQTVRHRPEGRYTTQIGDPNIIAERTGLTTVADFRRRDMAAGGQGAPLVPAFHAAVLSSADEPRVVVNIGGMANVTILAPGEPVRGFDTGPGNVLLDLWSQQHLGRTHDHNGDWAKSGKVEQGLLAAFLADGYFRLAPPKSTGREYFNQDWLDAHLTGFDLPFQDIQASLSELTARSIAEAVDVHAPQARRLLVCGGGVHNQDLMRRLTEATQRPVESTATYGIDPDWMEAMAFAWLARRTLEGKPGNLPSVTGARQAVVLGGIYAGGARSEE